MCDDLVRILATVRMEAEGRNRLRVRFTTARPRERGTPNEFLPECTIYDTLRVSMRFNVPCAPDRVTRHFLSHVRRSGAGDRMATQPVAGGPAGHRHGLGDGAVWLANWDAALPATGAGPVGGPQCLAEPAHRPAAVLRP